MSPTDIPPRSDADEPTRDTAGEVTSRPERAADVEAAPGEAPEQPGGAVGAEVPADQDATPGEAADAEPVDEHDETTGAVEAAAEGPGEDERTVMVVDAAEETEFEVPAYASIAERPIGVSDAVDADAEPPVDPEELARIAREHAAVAEALHGAVDVARSAAEADAGPELVGEHVGVQPEDTAAATHLFEARNAGYLGWRWAVTVACAGPDAPVTVSEVVLLPGPDALTAPEWVPWQDRVQAGDLGVGDLFPARKDDPRLVAGYVQSDDPAVEEVAHELGLGRVRVLSREGRLEAAARWADSEFGPRSDMARGAPGPCGTCGFFQQVAGSLRAAFGVCTNDISPADGHVVHVQYGCGAHSEVEVDTSPQVAVAELVYDDARLDYEPPLNPHPADSATTTETPSPDTPVAEPTKPASDTSASDAHTAGVTEKPSEATETAAEVTEKPVEATEAAAEATETHAEVTASAAPATAEPSEQSPEPQPDEPVSDTAAPEAHAPEAHAAGVTEKPAETTETGTESTAESTPVDSTESEHTPDSPDTPPGTPGD